MSPTSPRPLDRGREAPEGVAAPLVTVAFVLAFCFGGLLCVGAYALLRSREAIARPSGQFSEAHLPLRERVSEVLQEPYDVAYPRPDAKQRAAFTLNHYGWVDQRRGVVHIPIARAMQLLEARRSTALGDGEAVTP